MSVHSFVGFMADFPEGDPDDRPFGRELAEFVRAGLLSAGFEVSVQADCVWAWSLRTHHAGWTIETTVGLVDDTDSDPPRQWLVTNDCGIPLAKKLFGGEVARRARDGALLRFCSALHEHISSDDRFSHVFWYDPETFDGPDDQPTESPQGP